MSFNSYKEDEQLKENGKLKTLLRLLSYLLTYKKQIIAVLLIMDYFRHQALTVAWHLGCGCRHYVRAEPGSCRGSTHYASIYGCLYLAYPDLLP